MKPPRFVELPQTQSLQLPHPVLSCTAAARQIDCPADRSEARCEGDICHCMCRPGWRTPPAQGSQPLGERHPNPCSERVDDSDAVDVVDSSQPGAVQVDESPTWVQLVSTPPDIQLSDAPLT